MRKQLLLPFICQLAAGLCANAQNATDIDSLLRLLPAQKEDTGKVLLYIDIGNAYEHNNPDAAASYYRLAGQLSEKLHYNRGTVKYISNYTALLNQKAQFDSSLLLNKKAVTLAGSLHDKIILGKCYGNLGNVYQYMSDYENALLQYEMARRCFEEGGARKFEARVCDAMQNTYRELNQPQKAMELGRRAVAILRNEDEPLSLGMALLNLGNNYTKRQGDSALYYYQEALKIFEEQDFTRGIMTCFMDIGNVYMHRYDADSMQPYFNKALELARQLEEPESEAVALRGLSHCFLFKKDYVQAKDLVLRALKISDSLSLSYEHVKNLRSLSAVLYALQDIKAAEAALDSADMYEEKINSDEVQRKTLVISKRFEAEKKDAQIQLQQAQLKQQSTLNYFLAAGAAALLVISILGYRNYKGRQKLQQARIEELETEKQLTATEAVLRGQEQERSRLAKDLHDGLGGMLSGIKYSLSNMKENLIMTPDNAHAFNRSLDMLDSSIKEMRRVAHNMMPEILVKYGLDKALIEFCAEIDRSGVLQVSYHSVRLNEAKLDSIVELTIYRIVQELINNVIKHAAARNALVQLDYSETEKLLIITVEDDGRGMDIATLSKSEGIGWSSISNRVDFLKGKTDVKSSAGNGTSILITLPM
jgi:two-component system NarL family sensor kinase